MKFIPRKIKANGIQCKEKSTSDDIDIVYPWQTIVEHNDEMTSNVLDKLYINSRIKSPKDKEAMLNKIIKNGPDTVKNLYIKFLEDARRELVFEEMYTEDLIDLIDLAGDSLMTKRAKEEIFYRQINNINKNRKKER